MGRPGRGGVIDPKTDPLDSAYADAHFKERCRQLLTASRARTVCEIGGGRSPLFGLGEGRGLGVDYTVLDISAPELRRGPPRPTQGGGENAGPPCTAPPRPADTP